VQTAPFVEAVKRVSLVAARNAPSAWLLGRRRGARGRRRRRRAGLRAARLQLGGRGDGRAVPDRLQPAYLLDGLSAVDSDTTTLSFTGPTRPAVLTGKRADGRTPGVPADYRYLLMPVRLSG
jgi:DNA polymerase-3 subunit beta